MQTTPFVVNKVTMVDNAFAVPGADNCGIGDSGNWLVNLVAGTPADAGHNTAIFTQYAATKSYSQL
ncbi:hypothetical protein BJF79_19230 [Actinomadura sp. CNU-125]|uniref:hypothetical protein n=1 Tax=Actinomadura sp. CNU-125 TaxID=1904961 RepID=UPI0009632FBB|nr:hypothetical protein [Actinomadura sp. CNU-125]OLT14274.1 hypothetical protein BJF79_19230 [Actinomadura sp. CNU-125]